MAMTMPVVARLRVVSIVSIVAFISTIAGAEEPWLIGSDGVHYRATAPEILTRPILFSRSDASGLDATFIATDLRGTREDDWRSSQRVAGTQHVHNIDYPNPAFGVEAERRRLGIGGNANDWDNFSVQWDGLLLVPAGGIDLATTTDDGSRVWLDLNRDGEVQADEWGSNNWGRGQGATLRQVHTAVMPGTWPMRMQYEEGGGGNSCVLMWRPVRSIAPWTQVPVEAFARTPVLTVSGPATFRSPTTGEGQLCLNDGARLGIVPRVDVLSCAGRVSITADLALGPLPTYLARESTLALAGHRLSCDALLGEGTVQLDGGTLVLGKAGLLAVRGSGRLEVSGEVLLAGLDDRVEVVIAGTGSVRSSERSLVRRQLAAPLATVIEFGTVPDGMETLVIDLDGGLAGAGLMAWRADRHGRWFQRLAEPHLVDGRQHIEVDLSAAAALLPVGHDAAWNPLTAAESRHAGLLIYADRAVGGTVLADVHWTKTRHRAPEPQLTMLTLPPARVRTGERVALAVLPEPFPQWPLDPDCFSVELAVTAPDGSTTRYAGFADQPFRRSDRGDRESLAADGPARFGLRFRAKLAGEHRLGLTARWSDGSTATVALPSVVAEGPAWDDIARVDAGDPRFLSSQGRFVWPIGHNLNSNYDVRSVSAVATRLTPERGSFAREAFLARLIAAGGTGAETWLSPWNLGLEWTDAWSGFHGAGHPHLANAWALDRYLDIAERGNLRVLLTIFNHGQGRDGGGAEDDWPYHPWRIANGGWLDGPARLFDDARALKAQSNLFRYLAARWGDSPAVLAWKLWAEVNLTNAPNELKRSWHVQAADLFARHDPWRHPVTTHWSGDWSAVDTQIAAQPGMAMLTIDAYHGADRNIAELLGQSTRDPRRNSGGLARFGKPVLVAEYGGDWSGCDPRRMEAELAIGGWTAFVHGHAGAPMLWWFEWIDQGSHYGSFGALRRFTAGEDLRDPAARTVAHTLRAGLDPLWCRAWQRPGRILGYALDAAWAVRGGEGTTISDGELDLGETKPGPMYVEWWDADLGTVRSATGFDHPGGVMHLNVPDFRRHCAFKLWRSEG